MGRHVAELFPSPNGANFDAEWKGSINAVGLSEAVNITFITRAAVTGAVEVAYKEDPAAGDWVGLDPAVTVLAAKTTTLSVPPACKAVRLSGVAAANPAPARVMVRLVTP